VVGRKFKTRGLRNRLIPGTRCRVLVRLVLAAAAGASYVSVVGYCGCGLCTGSGGGT